jgi:hypothetical protein
MAKSTKALLTGRIQKCKTNPSIAHIGLGWKDDRTCGASQTFESEREAVDAWYNGKLIFNPPPFD